MSRNTVLIQLAAVCLLLAMQVGGQNRPTPDLTARAVPSLAAKSDLAITAPAPAPAAKSETVLFQYGYDQRIRNEEWNNIFEYNDARDDEKHTTSFRQRLWFRAPLISRNVEVYVRLLNQFAKTTLPVTRFNNDEVIVDNLYLNFKKTFIPGLSVQVGRQDLAFGEGFLLLDGSAGDGPRTNYVNAIDFTYSFGKSKLDVIGILDPRQERFFPLVHNQHRYLNEWDEQAIGMYYSNRNRKDTDADVYYFLKKEIHDYRAPGNAQFQPDRHVQTGGGRVVRRMSHGVSATGEFAYQWGYQHANLVASRPAENIRAFGGFGYVNKQFAAKYKPYVQAGYYALSGDDGSSTGTYEGFDPLFSRWPKWSGGYVWSFTPEKGTGYWTNLKMVQMEAGFSPCKPLTLSTTYLVMDAFHPWIAGSASVFSRTGTHRGQMPQFLAQYKFGDSVVGQVRYEVTQPGDYFVGNGTGQYFRFEINYAFKGTVHSERR